MSKYKKERKMHNEPVAAAETAVETVVAVQAEPLEAAEVDADLEGIAEVDAVLEEISSQDASIPEDPLPEPVAEAVAAAESVPEAAEAFELPEALVKQIAALKAKIEELSAARSKRIASGSKPRPNMVYTLLSRPAKWTGAPQVGQLLDIIFDPEFVAIHKDQNGKVEVAEPDLFAAIEAGAAAGKLRTKQPPVRIFQYYRSDLRKADAIAWR